MFKINTISDYCNLSLSSILAGICISIGCIVNLMSGGGIIGAVLFTFGLITVVHYKYALYTGTAGFVSSFSDIINVLCIVFIYNVIGCIIMAQLMQYAMPDIIEKCNVIAEARSQINIWQAFIRAIFCGFLMTTAVKFAREGKWLPLIWAVPVFILAGFYHSIADTFYIFCSNLQNPNIFYNWLMTITGNFVGCNLHRLKYKDN